MRRSLTGCASHRPGRAHPARLSAGASRSAPASASTSTSSPRAWPRRLGPADALTLFSSSWKDRLAAGRVPGAPVVDARVPVRLLNFAWHRLELAAGRAARRRRRRRPLAHPLLMPAARRRAGRHDLRPRLPRSSGAHAARRSGATTRRWRAAHAPRADGRRHHLALHRRRGRAPARRRRRSHRRLLAGRAGLAAARRAGAARVRSCSSARSSRARTSACCSMPTRGCVQRDPAAPPLCWPAAPTEASDALAARDRASRRSPAASSHLGYVAERRALRRSTRRRSMLVLPSHIEGFGMPALEAMTAGVPVDRQPTAARCRKSSGDAAQLVEPDDVAGLAAAMRALPRRSGRARRRPRARGLRARGAVFLGRAARATLRRRLRARARGMSAVADAAHASASTRASCSASRPASAAISASCCAAGRRGATRRRGGSSSTAPEPLPFLRTVPDTADVREVVAGSGRGTWWEQTHLRRAVRRDPPDVFFAPAYTAPLALGVPLVVTIHDVSFCAHPEWFRPREGRAAPAARRGGRARGATSSSPISEFSRGEIVRAAVGSRRIAMRVIPPGVTRRAPAARRRRASRSCCSSARSSTGGSCRTLIAAFAPRPRRVPTRGWSSSATTARYPRWISRGLAARSRRRRRASRSRSYVSDAELDVALRAARRSSRSCRSTKASG